MPRLHHSSLKSNSGIEQQKPRVSSGLFNLIGQRPTLPHTRACSTIGAEGLNFRVRDGNGWNPLATVTQKRAANQRVHSRFANICVDSRLNIDGLPLFLSARTTPCGCALFLRPRTALSAARSYFVARADHSVSTVKFYGQAERAISNGQLNVLLRLHIRPINVVVFHGPS
jgi:hypothetical protein